MVLHKDFRYKPIDYPIDAATHPAHYLMHKYWARKPHNIINAYIEYFTKPGDLVLDPFMGSGVTIIEALKLNRRALGVDINPVAHFITESTVRPVSLDALKDNFNLLKEKAASIINRLYTTNCIYCGRNAHAISYHWLNGQPVEVKYCCNCYSQRKAIIKKFSFKDNEILESINRNYFTFIKDYNLWIPTIELPKNNQINAPGYGVTDLFTRRNLLALGLLLKAIEKYVDISVKDIMRFVFSSALVQGSKMIMHSKGQGPGWKVMGFWIPHNGASQELNVWHYFSNKFKRIYRGKKETNTLIKSGNYLLLQQSAANLPQIEDNSVDYVFTDPPYGASVPYLEMSSLWAAWLGFTLNYREEIVVSKNETYNKSLDNYKIMLLAAFKEIYNKMKPGAYMSLTFHNRDLRIWKILLYCLREAGFELINVVHQPQAKLSSSQGLYHQKRITGDFILNFIKPLRRHIFMPAAKINLEKTVVNKTRELIKKQGGATTDLVYQELIPLFVNSGALDEEENIQKDLEQILSKYFEQVKEEQTSNRGKKLEVYKWQERH
ncbi:DNA methyltransferase [Desulfolucanica intricata]|uniref:DNA methyltransferase n=1 Tax=Desulfolucanica intricata TaxID=1285191 RepID=UPI0008377DF6|nr:DNA methyltransferase [Desulfolucanica intricata]